MYLGAFIITRPLIQMALDSLEFNDKRKTDTFYLKTFNDYLCPKIEYKKTPIPKPSKNMYQTKRGKWVNCK